MSKCTCGTTGGHPHEPDCPWWDDIDRAAREAREAPGPPIDRRVANVPLRRRLSRFVVRSGRVVMVR